LQLENSPHQSTSSFRSSLLTVLGQTGCNRNTYTFFRRHIVPNYISSVIQSELLYLIDESIHKYTGLFISPSGISELCSTITKTDTAERSISTDRETLQVCNASSWRTVLDSAILCFYKILLVSSMLMHLHHFIQAVPYYTRNPFTHKTTKLMAVFNCCSRIPLLQSMHCFTSVRT
jgi:hypothetical protein